MVFAIKPFQNCPTERAQFQDDWSGDHVEVL